MALTLNTGHALYGDLIALICVDDDDVVKDLKGDTCTKHTNCTVGTGTYGRHFRTVLNANNAEGVALTTGFQPKPTANPVGTSFVVINAGNSRSSRGQVFDTTLSSNKVGPAVYTGDVASVLVGSATPGELGTTDILGTGAFSFGMGVNGTSGAKAFVNGVTEASTASNRGNASADADKYIGGSPSGGFGGFAADYVWVAHFRKYLSDAEILDLHNSLGASNAFGLVGAGALTLTPSLFTNTNTFYAPTVAPGAVDLTPSLFTNDNTFYSATVTLAGGSQTLTPGLFSNSNTFYGPTVVRTPGFLTPVMKNNTGAVWATETGITCNVYNQSTGALVLHKTGLTADANGVVSVTDNAMVEGTTYDYNIKLGTAQRLPTAVA